MKRHNKYINTQKNWFSFLISISFLLIVFQLFIVLYYFIHFIFYLFDIPFYFVDFFHLPLIFLKVISIIIFILFYIRFYSIYFFLFTHFSFYSFIYLFECQTKENEKTLRLKMVMIFCPCRIE